MCKSTTDTSTFKCKCLEDELDMISISAREYNSLVADSAFLGYLESWGVDNWSGYEEAHREFRENK